MGLKEDFRDQLAGYLDQGWGVVGYNTQILALGKLIHFVLIQNQYALKSVAIIMAGDKVVGCTITDLAPAGVKV